MADKLRTLAQISLAVGVMALAAQAAFEQNWWFFFGQGFALILVRLAWSAIDALPRWGENVQRVLERRERD